MALIYADLAEDGTLVETISTIEDLKKYTYNFNNEFPVTLTSNFCIFVSLSCEGTATHYVNLPTSISELQLILDELEDEVNFNKKED